MGLSWGRRRRLSADEQCESGCQDPERLKAQYDNREDGSGEQRNQETREPCGHDLLPFAPHCIPGERDITRGIMTFNLCQWRFRLCYD